MSKPKFKVGDKFYSYFDDGYDGRIITGRIIGNGRINLPDCICEYRIILNGKQECYWEEDRLYSYTSEGLEQIKKYLIEVHQKYLDKCKENYEKALKRIEKFKG